MLTENNIDLLISKIDDLTKCQYLNITLSNSDIFTEVEFYYHNKNIRFITNNDMLQHDFMHLEQLVSAVSNN